MKQSVKKQPPQSLSFHSLDEASGLQTWVNWSLDHCCSVQLVLLAMVGFDGSIVLNLAAAQFASQQGLSNDCRGTLRRLAKAREMLEDSILLVSVPEVDLREVFFTCPLLSSSIGSLNKLGLAMISVPLGMVTPRGRLEWWWSKTAELLSFFSWWISGAGVGCTKGWIIAMMLVLDQELSETASEATPTVALI